MRTIAAAVFLAFAVAPAAFCQDPPPAAEAKPPDRAATFHEEKPEDFRQRPEANEKIDFDRIDTALLDAAVFHETNRRRVEHDLAPLKFLSALREAARLQARAMVKLEKVTHENPAGKQSSPADRMKLVGLDGHYYAENVAMTFGIRYEAGTPVYPREVDGKRIFSTEPNGEPIHPHTYLSFAKVLLDQWMASPGHRENILSSEPEFLGVSCLHDRSAMGMDSFYCAQEFYAPFER